MREESALLRIYFYLLLNLVQLCSASRIILVTNEHETGSCRYKSMLVIDYWNVPMQCQYRVESS